MLTREAFENVFMDLKKEVDVDRYNESLGLVWGHDAEQRQAIGLWQNTCRAKDEEISRLQAELNEVWVDEREVTWRRPTAWAYAQVCRVKDEQQRVIEQQAQEIIKLEKRLRDENDANAYANNETRTVLSRGIMDRDILLQSRERTIQALRTALKRIVTMPQDNLRQALSTGDHLKIIAETTRLFNTCRDQAQRVLEETP